MKRLLLVLSPACGLLLAGGCCPNTIELGLLLLQAVTGGQAPQQ